MVTSVSGLNGGDLCTNYLNSLIFKRIPLWQEGRNPKKRRGGKERREGGKGGRKRKEWEREKEREGKDTERQKNRD